MEELILSPSYKLDPCDLWKQVDEVAEDFTLLDLVRIVRAAETDHPGLAAVFGMPCIDAFYEEVTRERDPDDDDNVTYLELYWTFEHDVEDIPEARRWNRRRPKGRMRMPDIRETPERGEMRNLMCFHGIGKHWDDLNMGCDDPGCQHHNAYGIWTMSLNNLAHLPIRADIRCRVYRPSLAMLRHPIRRAAIRLGRLGAPILRWWNARAESPILTIEIRPTLHAFISSVFWELTFGGYHPDERDAKTEEINKACEEAEGASERGELTSLDDMLDGLDERRGSEDDE